MTLLTHSCVACGAAFDSKFIFCENCRNKLVVKEDTIRKSIKSLGVSIMDVCSLWAVDRSKDPSTKVGAAIYDPRSGGLFLGYNGFPAGIIDSDEVWQRRTDPTELEKETTNFLLTKYDLVVHAEVNAVRKALMGGVDLTAATLVCSLLPCPDCMKNVVLANGIKRVLYLDDKYNSQNSRKLWLVNTLARLGMVQLEKLKL
jgi:dCMP deaminase